MYPFECTKCKKRFYAPSERLAVCCDNAKPLPLVNICLLLPIEYAPDHHVIHTVASNTVLPTQNGKPCVTACNSRIKPKIATGFVHAATCRKCLDWVENYKKAQLVKRELDAMEYYAKNVEFVDEENPENNFQSEVDTIREKVTKSLSDFKNFDEIMEEVKNLHNRTKNRMMLQNRNLKIQELKTK